MTKKDISQLGLSPLPQSNGGAMVIYGAVASMGIPQSKSEQQIVVETNKQLQVIRNQRLKAEAAAHEISQVHQQGSQEFVEIAAHLSALKEQAKGKDYQGLVDEFTQRSAQLAAQHLFGVMEVSARNIGMETARPLYREEEVPVVKVVERRGLLQRLLGD